MKSVLSRLLVVVLLSVILFATAAFIVSMLRVPALDLLGELYWNWVVSNTLEQLMNLFPAAAVFSVVVAVGLFVDHFHVVRSTGRLGLLKTLGGFALGISLIHAILVLSIMPLAGEAKNEALAASSAVDHHRQRFEAQLSAGRFDLARDHAETISRIIPALEGEVEERLSQLREAQARHAEDTATQQPSEPQSQRLPRQQTASDAFNRALQAFEEEDWFTAHLYARRAYDVDPRLGEARVLAEDAWEEIGRAARENERTERFERKRAGLRALTEDRPVDAYYIFRDLADAHPGDRDVERYLAEARRAVSEIAFFVEDIEDLTGLPGQSDIIYMQESDEYRYELIHFDRLVGEPAVRFAVGIEAVGIDHDGQLAYRFRAPVGRFTAGNLSVLALDPDDPAGGSDAEYLHGSRPEGFESLIPLETTTTQMLRVSRAQSAPARLHALDLFRIHDDETISSFVQESAQQELMSRLLAPFTVFIAVILGACAAFRGRSRYADRPPVLSLLLLPVLALAAIGAVMVLFYLQDIVAALTLIMLPFGGALMVQLVLQTFLLFTALVISVRTFR